MLGSVDLEELKKSVIAKDSPILLEIKETTKLRKKIEKFLLKFKFPLYNQNCKRGKIY